MKDKCFRCKAYQRSYQGNNGGAGYTRASCLLMCDMNDNVECPRPLQYAKLGKLYDQVELEREIREGWGRGKKVTES